MYRKTSRHKDKLRRYSRPMDGSFRVRRYSLHYIGIPLSARTGTAPRSVTEHVFIVVIVMISQRLCLRRVISNHSKVILNQN